MLTTISTGHFERCPYGSGLGCTDRHARKVWAAVSARDVLDGLRPMYRDPGPVLGEMVRHGRIVHSPDATYRYVPPAPPPVSGGGPDELDRVRPFSNGSQFGDWVSSNCDRCTKGTAEQEPHELCGIARELGEASWGDGIVSADIARRMGYEPGSTRYTWPCGEVVWTPEWRAEWAAKHGVAPDDWPRDATREEKRAEAAEAWRMVSEGMR